MFWVGIATLIMMFSDESDLAKVFAETTAAYEKAITEVVPDPERRAAAVEAMRGLRSTSEDRVRALAVLGECLESADRSYDASAATYQVCWEGADVRWQALEQGILEFHQKTRAAFLGDEWQRVMHVVREGMEP
jgi:hypothetical protein